jgi:hypothetical protein
MASSHCIICPCCSSEHDGDALHIARLRKEFGPHFNVAEIRARLREAAALFEADPERMTPTRKNFIKEAKRISR